MIKQDNDISHFVNGCNTPYYELVIQSIRNFLENIDEINKSQGGALVFFQKLQDNEYDLSMQVYPFKSNIFLLDEGKCPLEKKQVEEIFKLINIPKPYQDFWHQKQFKNHNCSDEHCEAKVPDENIITYDSDSIHYHTHDPNSDKVQQHTTDWNAFFEKFMKGHIHKNTYEQLLFESGCKGVSFVPIPVLSTPSILLVLNNKYLTNKHGLFKSIYFRSRDTVNSYLYSRLMDSITPLLGVYAKDKNGERRLVEAFVEEICNIILPISYNINKETEILYYPHWPENGFESEYKLPLLGGEYTVTFKLTSFYYVDVENPDNSEWTWLHQSKSYESIKTQSTLLLCKIFNLLYNNLKLIRNAKERAYEELSKAIGGIDIEGLKSKINEIDDRFVKIKSDFGASSPMNKLTIEDNKVHLVVDGIEIISPIECRGSNQVSGFIYLQHILQCASQTGNVFEISQEQLYKEVDVVKTLKPDMQITRKKETAQNVLDDNLEVIYNNFIEFSTSFGSKIKEVISSNTISRDKVFNDSFYFNASFFTYLTGSKTGILTRMPKSFGVGERIKEDEDEEDIHESIDAKSSKRHLLTKSVREIAAVLKIYNEKDEEGTTKAIAKVNKTSFTSEITKSRKILSLDASGIDFKSSMRECFKAMIELLKHNMEIATAERLHALEKLLQNLEVAGLIKSHVSEAVLSRGKYTYNQQNKKPFIKWET